MFLDLEFAGTLSLSLPLKNRIPRSSTLITAVFAREYTQIGLFNNLGRDGGRRTGLESSGRLKASFYRGARARREREPENGERGETGQPIRREQAGQDEKQDAAGQGAFVKGTTKKDHDFSRVCVCVCVCVCLLVAHHFGSVGPLYRLRAIAKSPATGVRTRLPYGTMIIIVFRRGSTRVHARPCVYRAIFIIIRVTFSKLF